MAQGVGELALRKRRTGASPASSRCASVLTWGGAPGSLFCAKAGETLLLSGPCALLRNAVFSKELPPAASDSRSQVRLLLPVLKMTHGNEEKEPRAQGDRAGKQPFFSCSLFFPLQVR